ncbi:MAG: DUF6762 family protein [bacterium]
MDTVIVIMLKDNKTGLFIKELQTLNISKNEDFLLNVYAVQDDLINIYVKITTNRDVLDWEFNAIYDYYDKDIFLEVLDNKNNNILEQEEEYNPTWELSFEYKQEYDQNVEILTEKINNILDLHKNEIEDVLETIKDKQGDYKSEV